MKKLSSDSLTLGIIQVNENTETGFEVINDPVANRENLLRMAYNTGAGILDELTADQKKKREGSRKGPYQVHPDEGGKPGEKHKTDRGHPRAPDRMGSERQHHGRSPSHPLSLIHILTLPTNREV